MSTSDIKPEIKEETVSAESSTVQASADVAALTTQSKFYNSKLIQILELWCIREE